MTGGRGVDDDALLRLIGEEIGETIDREQLVRARRRDFDELLERVGLVGDADAARRQRLDRFLDLASECVAEAAPFGAGVDRLDGEIRGRLLVREDVANYVRRIDGDNREFLAGMFRRELKRDRSRGRSFADAAFAGEENEFGGWRNIERGTSFSLRAKTRGEKVPFAEANGG